MVPVKTMKEYDMLQEVTILFCETVNRLVTIRYVCCSGLCQSLSGGKALEKRSLGHGLGVRHRSKDNWVMV